MDLEMVELAEAYVLKLDGSWTIERAQELKHALVEALKDSDHITIETEGLREVDLSALQLLCSAHRTSLRLS